MASSWVCPYFPAPHFIVSNFFFCSHAFYHLFWVRGGRNVHRCGTRAMSNCQGVDERLDVHMMLEGRIFRTAIGCMLIGCMLTTMIRICNCRWPCMTLEALDRCVVNLSQVHWQLATRNMFVIGFMRNNSVDDRVEDHQRARSAASIQYLTCDCVKLIKG